MIEKLVKINHPISTFKLGCIRELQFPTMIGLVYTCCVHVVLVIPIKKSQCDGHSFFKEAVWRSG